MNQKLSFCVLISFCFLQLPLLAQTLQQESPLPFYWGGQIGSQLFWGDLYSTGSKIHPGIGLGLHTGYRANHWLGIELGFELGKGTLAPRSWQESDMIDKNGTITYINGTYKLSEIQSKTSFARLGARIPIRLINLFSGRERQFNIELAPHYFINKFDPELVLAESGEQWSSGARPKPWSHAFGGDLGVNYQLRPKTSIFLRSSISWLSDDQFEGVRTDPSWRVNIHGSASLGVRFAFGKQKSTKKERRIINEDVSLPADPQVKPSEPEIDSLQEKVQEQEQLEALEAVVETDESNTTGSTARYLNEMAVLYFKSNSAFLDLKRYAKQLDQLVHTYNKYPDVQVVISGWADRNGSVALNDTLSQERAQVVANYLISQGVDASRIQHSGRGIDHMRIILKSGRRVEIRLKTN